MKLTNLIFFFLTIHSLTGCKSTTIHDEKLPKESELKELIIREISIEPNHFDTIRYESIIGVCGNSSKEEIDAIYIPYLGGHPFDSLLSKKLGAFVLINEPYHRKIRHPSLKFMGSIDSNTVHISESLSLGIDSLIYSHSKYFIFENNKWSRE